MDQYKQQEWTNLQSYSTDGNYSNNQGGGNFLQDPMPGIPRVQSTISTSSTSASHSNQGGYYQQQQQQQQTPGLTKLNSILQSTSVTPMPQPMMMQSGGGMSSMRMQQQQQGGATSPRGFSVNENNARSMKLDEILGARSESTINRGISVRVGSGSSGNGGGGNLSPAHGGGMQQQQQQQQQQSFRGVSVGGMNPASFRYGGGNDNMMMMGGGGGGNESLLRQSSSMMVDAPRSPRASNRIQAFVTFSQELMEIFGRLDVADRCRVGQKLRSDVISHFRDLHAIAPEDILISFELTDAMQLQTTFELPSTVDSRTRSIILFRAKTPVRPDSMMEELRKFQ